MRVLHAVKVSPGLSSGTGNSGRSGWRLTLTLPQLVYNLGFQRFDIGAACVIALVLFALSMAFAAVLMRRNSVFLGGDS